MPKPNITTFTSVKVRPDSSSSTKILYAPSLSTVELTALLPPQNPITSGIVYDSTLNIFKFGVNGKYVSGGDVVGPAVAVAGNVAIFDGTTGKIIADSGVHIGPAVPLDVPEGLLSAPEAPEFGGEPLGLLSLEPANNIEISNIGYIQFNNAGTGGILVDSLVGLHLVNNGLIGDDAQVCTIMGPGFGTSSTSVSSLLELQSTTGVIQISRMTGAQRDELLQVSGDSKNGMMLYNKTTKTFNFGEDGAWVSYGAGDGTVTSITAGTGLTGGTITSSGTIALADTTVTPGSYTLMAGTVDSMGRVTAASSGSAVTSVIAGSGLSGGTITSTGTISLPTTGVTAGSYTNGSFTVDAHGILTAASSGSAGNVTGPGSSVANNIATFSNTTGLVIKDGGIFLRSGAGNIGLGTSTVLASITSGASNIGIGDGVLQATTNGTFNLGLGQNALKQNLGGADNISLGTNSLTTNTSGSYNVAIASGALYSNTTSSYNVALGVNSLYSNQIGTNNAALGFNALYANQSGSYNLGIGGSCLGSNTTGGNNVGIGNTALGTNLSGSYNVGIGTLALYSNSTSDASVAIGYNSLRNNLVSYSVGIGASAMYSNTTGISNTAVGSSALYSNTTKGSHTAVGTNALYTNSSGSNNTSVGNGALYNNSSGSNNVAVGDQAGNAYNYNNCTLLGAQTSGASSGLTNITAIGYATIPSTSNSVVLGTGCSVGIGKNGPTYALHMGTDNSMIPLIYMASASVPSAPGTANDGIYSVASGVPTFTSGTATRSGTIVTANSSGAAATVGATTLNGTTGVTVNTTAVTTASVINIVRSGFAALPTLSGTGDIAYGNIVNNTSFTIYSTNVLDTSATVMWMIINP